MNDKIKINLQIADVTYPLFIKSDDEELVRKAGKQINDKLNKYRAHFPNLEPEKFMAMVALDLSTENLRLEKKNDIEPFAESIKQLTEELEEYFKKE
ncbi:MAG: cell division protein ZapA [Bacteroidaceae bacterium]